MCFFCGLLSLFTISPSSFKAYISVTLWLPSVAFYHLLPPIYRPCVTHWTSPSPFTASSLPLKPALRFRIPLGAGFSEKYHVSPLSILWHCSDVVFNAPTCLHYCMLSVALRWHTIEEVRWPGGKYVMKYLLSDYKPAPLPFLPLTQYICVIFCLSHFFTK